MNQNIVIVKNSSIKQHEKIIQSHVIELLNQIKADGYISDPIIVDKNTMIILDGHHRFNVIKKLGLTASPVHFVDYKNKEIQVTAWREESGKITKKHVVKAGLSGKLLEPKTSKHFIPQRPTGLRILLSKLV